jgi:glycosyltransferase involved in cell wall biosynthesis
MTSESRPLVSIAIPAYNESENLDQLFTRLCAVFAELQHQYDFEVVICENGSTDDSLQQLVSIRQADPRFKIVQLSRNFHMEGGMMAAVSKVQGDVCIIMSADLQDPPELIPTLLDRWQEGFDHVYTVITYRHGEGRLRRFAAEIFYWLINRVSETPVPRNASDFRLVSREMYLTFNSLPERVRMVRALWGWIGFKSTSVSYERAPRVRGISSFKVGVTTAFAVRGILSSSLSPLRVIPLLGMALSLLAFFGVIGITIRAVFFGVPFAGFGTITALTLLLFGLLFLLLSILAEYIAMIFLETRGRPMFVERTIPNESHTKIRS